MRPLPPRHPVKAEPRPPGSAASTVHRPPDAATALAELRLTQMRALRHRFRNDLQSVCSLAALHGSRADGLASQSGFDAVGRRATALAALYDELLCSEGVEAIDFASYLAALCGRLAAAESPTGTRLALHVVGGAVWSAALALQSHTASALGTALAALIASVGGGTALKTSSRVLVQLMPASEDGCSRRRRGRLTVSASGIPADVERQPSDRGYGLQLARSLVVQAGGELDRFVSCTGAGWCIHF